MSAPGEWLELSRLNKSGPEIPAQKSKKCVVSMRVKVVISVDQKTAGIQDCYGARTGYQIGRMVLGAGFACIRKGEGDVVSSGAVVKSGAGTHDNVNTITDGTDCGSQSREVEAISGEVDL